MAGKIIILILMAVFYISYFIKMLSQIKHGIATVIVNVFFRLQFVNVEEKFLEQAFGEEYPEYKNKVFRYIGRKI